MNEAERNYLPPRVYPEGVFGFFDVYVKFAQKMTNIFSIRITKSFYYIIDFIFT